MGFGTFRRASFSLGKGARPTLVVSVTRGPPVAKWLSDCGTFCPFSIARPVRGWCECADYSARGADHARRERRRRHSIAIAIHIEHRFVVAQLADDPQRAHALRPHVLERHRWAAVAVRGHYRILGGLAAFSSLSLAIRW
jgi:hypothetical protein